MLSARIPNHIRKAVYRRDGFRCALCDDTAGLQIHHAIMRSEGGTDYPHNLITLCWKCHAVAHGTRLPGYEGITADDLQQSCVEYLSDYYANQGLLWCPWQERMDKVWGP